MNEHTKTGEQNNSAFNAEVNSSRGDISKLASKSKLTIRDTYDIFRKKKDTCQSYFKKTLEFFLRNIFAFLYFHDIILYVNIYSVK